MSDLVGKTVSLTKIYPAPGAYGLNTCSNPDCRSFGVRPLDRVAFVAAQQAQGAPAAQIKTALARQPGLYMLRGGDAKRRRTISFLCKNTPKAWIDQRLVQCTTMLHTGAICGTSFSLGSEQQVEDEVARLRRVNGVLDGAACGCCGTRYLEAPDEFILHRISHDDMVINVNWETASDNRHTQLNCSVSADASSGYVYRINVDFDPTVEPLEMFRSAYVATPGKGLSWLKNLHRRHNTGTPNAMTLPRFFRERPTGRLFEQQFFAACAHELRVFLKRLEKQHPRTTPAEEAQLEAFRDQANRELRAIETIGTGWFGFQDNSTEVRGSSKGMTTRKIYTKTAHFALLREMLPPGQIILTAEQEAVIANTVAHIFREEVKDNRFTWQAMTFNKGATKPQRTSKLNRYRDQWRKFREAGLFSGRFDHRTTSKDITLAFIADKMTVATGGRPGNPQPFHHPTSRAPSRCSGSSPRPRAVASSTRWWGSPWRPPSCVID